MKCVVKRKEYKEGKKRKVLSTGELEKMSDLQKCGQK